MTQPNAHRVVIAYALHQASVQKVADAAFEKALDALVDSWTDGLLDAASSVKIDDDAVGDALSQAGLSAGNVNALTPEGVKTAGLGDWISALGGKILKGAWHALTNPFLSAWKLLTSTSYRQEIKKSIKKAVSHEIRSTKHLAQVAMRLAQGEKVPPKEAKAAAMQFADIASKVILGIIIGPHVAHLFAAGPIKALLSLMSPLDEVAGVAFDKPLRWISKKFLGEAIGLLPSGFYTHF